MNLNHKFEYEAVDHVIEKGLKYIISKGVNGHWRGFPTMAGTSDVWVTGFVLAHINRLCDNNDTIKKSQQFLLQSQHSSGGWSYSAMVPPDADSTTWCMLALQSNRELTNLALDKAKVFLWSHFKDKGVSTYSIESGIRQFISAPSDDFIAGWTSAHADVSIAAVIADINNIEVPEILNWLINKQSSDGLFNSYWYRGPYYTTTLLLRALSLQQQYLPAEKSRKVVEALSHQQLKDGGFGLGVSEMADAFNTALALESFVHLSYLGHDQERTACGNALLKFQQQDGSWPGGLILRIPAPDVIDPNQVTTWNSISGGGNSYVADQEGLFATAMACYALDCWRKGELNKKTAKS
jgi:hypothetical protein